MFQVTVYCIIFQRNHYFGTWDRLPGLVSIQYELNRDRDATSPARYRVRILQDVKLLQNLSTTTPC